MGYWIVVVDDEPLSLMNAKKLLGEQDMRVSCLRSGQDLLKFMESKTPDLILLDILMPEMDGFETYRALRQMEDAGGKPNTPVIFLSGENSSDIERRGLKAGASDFIRKPFDKDVLVRRIHNTIDNSRMIESLTEEATVDKLTGFLNKNCGKGKIEKLCKERTGALMIFDLDSFKLVNDLYGHDMGDKVLEVVAEIMRHNTRSEDVLSRIGGDEFMGFFPELTGEGAVASLTKRLNEQLLEKCRELMGKDFGIPIGISVGAVFAPKHGTDYNQLFRHADSSLYKVKQQGKHGYSIYDPATSSDNAENGLENEMARIKKLVEERSEPRGAMLLGVDDFTACYRLTKRLVKGQDEKVMKFIFAVSPKESNQDITSEVQGFSGVLEKTLGIGDIILRNRPDQFFVLKRMKPGETAETVTGQILEAWNATGFEDSVEIKSLSAEC